MTEAIFPLLGAAFTLLFVLPGCALLTKGLLALGRLLSPRSEMRALDIRYCLLVCATCLPLGWLLSAGAHQAETGRSAVDCLIDHGRAGACSEAALFTAVLAAAALSLAHRRRRVTPSANDCPRAADEFQQRLDAVLGESAALAQLRGRVQSVGRSPLGPIATVGWWRPQVIVETRFAEQLNDAELAGALAHELEHVRGRDPARYGLLSLALRICPFGELLLGREAARWLLAHEAQCDREAVRHGADATALAQALVCAARPVTWVSTAALAAADTAAIRLRVALLLSEQSSGVGGRLRSPTASLRTVLAIVMLVLFLPHVSGTRALDLLHKSAESTLYLFAR